MAWDYGLLNGPINDFNFGLEGQFIGLILVFLTIIAITRNTKHMRLIMLSIAAGWARLGLDIHWVFIWLAAIVTIVSVFSMHLIGSMLKSARSKITLKTPRTPQPSKITWSRIKQLTPSSPAATAGNTSQESYIQEMPNDN